LIAYINFLLLFVTKELSRFSTHSSAVWVLVIWENVHTRFPVDILTLARNCSMLLAQDVALINGASGLDDVPFKKYAYSDAKCANKNRPRILYTRQP
jgi:hypothetical protein